MIKFLFRFMGLFLLAVAVILAVIDATRSVAASELVMTPLGQSWFAVSPSTINLAQALVQRYTLPVIWDPAIVWVLTMPGFTVFAVLAVLFLQIGTRRRKRGIQIKSA